MGVVRYKHSGDIGDIVYAMPTVKYYGGGVMYLNTKQEFKLPPYPKFNDKAFNAIAPLLLEQEYIKEVSLYNGEYVDFDLDIFRLNDDLSQNLAKLHCVTFGAPTKILNEAWLNVDIRTPQKPVVVNKSMRYDSRTFKWDRDLVKITPLEDVTFIGLEDEHDAFCELVDFKVHWTKTNDLLEAAEYIAGSDLFIGNQSSPYSIAEGLKVRRVLVSADYVPNCNFDDDKDNLLIL